MRGVGIRYVLALTLPVAGIVLVLVTVVQLVLAHHDGMPPAPPRMVRSGLAAPAFPPALAMPAPATAGPSSGPESGSSPSRPVLP